jgi:hypothetical protein
MSERNAAPQGAINEAIATLDHIGRADLGTAVKDLWAELERTVGALREIKEHGETCEDSAEMCRRDWIPMACDAALRGATP